MIKNTIIALLLIALSAILYLQWFKEGFIFFDFDSGYRSFEQENYRIVTHKEKPGLLFSSHDATLVTQVIDSDNDGTVDLLSYSHFDSRLQQRIEYYDYEMNGQTDFRIIYPQSDNNNASFEVFYSNSWYQLRGKHPDLHILVDDKEIPVMSSHDALPFIPKPNM